MLRLGVRNPNGGVGDVQLVLECARSFYLPLFRRCIRFRQLLLGSYPPLKQLFIDRLFHRCHLLAQTSLRVRLLLFGFLFGGYTRSLPPVADQQVTCPRGSSKVVRSGVPQASGGAHEDSLSCDSFSG